MEWYAFALISMYSRSEADFWAFQSQAGYCKASNA